MTLKCDFPMMLDRGLRCSIILGVFASYLFLSYFMFGIFLILRKEAALADSCFYIFSFQSIYFHCRVIKFYARVLFIMSC